MNKSFFLLFLVVNLVVAQIMMLTRNCHVAISASKYVTSLRMILTIPPNKKRFLPFPSCFRAFHLIISISHHTKKEELCLYHRLITIHSAVTCSLQGRFWVGGSEKERRSPATATTSCVSVSSYFSPFAFSFVVYCKLWSFCCLYTRGSSLISFFLSSPFVFIFVWIWKNTSFKCVGKGKEKQRGRDVSTRQHAQEIPYPPLNKL